MMFSNGAEYAALYPDDPRPTWAFSALRLERNAAATTAIRAALLARAAMLGHTLDREPDPHLIVDGAIVRPEVTGARIYRYPIPSGAVELWLGSSSAVPGETVAESCDTRRLGVAVESIALRGENMSIEARHGHADLRDGFHADDATHRWTNGLARLPVEWMRPLRGAITLELRLASTELPYWQRRETAATEALETADRPDAHRLGAASNV
jgi:hypothetical protein